MAQSDARFGYKAKLSRENHDLSRKFGFTTCPGMLNPIFADIASPGDTYYIEHDLEFLRTAPLAAPAMIDVFVHYETFFIPFQMIYQAFENTFFSLANYQSSLFYYSSATPGSQNNNFPLFDYKYYVNDIYARGSTSIYHALAYRFADLMGINPFALAVQNYTADTQSGGYNFTGSSPCFYYPNFFPWQALAYHTIYQYYYRLDDKSNFKVQFCNWDINFDSTSAVKYAYNAGGSAGMEYGFFTIYQRPWDFDYFSSLYRSPIVSTENMQNILPSSQYSSLLGDSNNYSNQVAMTSTGGSASLNSSIATFAMSQGSTYSYTNMRLNSNPAMIRQLFANEKLAMITGRTRKNYDAQVLAHFGKSVPRDIKHDLVLVGRDTYKLHIGEVTSLASTSDAPLGDLAGKGYTSGKGKKHKFEAPVHGIIMTIFSIEPRRRYCTGIERQNMVTTAFDLPIPEFDRMGNVPMYYYEAGVQLLSTPFTNIAGWKERYYYWKRRYDKLTTAFMPRLIGTPVGNENSYSAYFVSYVPFSKKLTNSPYPGTEYSFYIDRQAMDDLMLVGFLDGWQRSSEEGGENWDNTPWLVYARDPFIVNSDEKVTKVSWLSKDGEPVYQY